VGLRRSGRLDDNGTPLVSYSDLIEACCAAGGALEPGPLGLEQISDAVIPAVVRRLFEQPPIPLGVLEPERPRDTDAF
jgi:hypothetical protein